MESMTTRAIFFWDEWLKIERCIDVPPRQQRPEMDLYVKLKKLQMENNAPPTHLI